MILDSDGLPMSAAAIESLKDLFPGPALATGPAPDLATETVSYPGGGAGYPAALHVAIDRVLVRCWAEAAAPDLPRGRVYRSRRHLRGRRTNAIAGEL